MQDAPGFSSNGASSFGSGTSCSARRCRPPPSRTAIPRPLLLDISRSTARSTRISINWSGRKLPLRQAFPRQRCRSIVRKPVFRSASRSSALISRTARRLPSPSSSSGISAASYRLPVMPAETKLLHQWHRSTPRRGCFEAPSWARAGNVGSGSKASFSPSSGHFRSSPTSGPFQGPSACLIGACQQATSISDGGSVSGDRKLKQSTPRLAGGRPQPAPVGIDDRPADRESHTHAAGFGGEEGVEQPVRILGGDPDAAIRYTYKHLVRLVLTRSDHQLARPIRDRLHRFNAIHHQVNDHLLQLDPITKDHG